jgi:uncharacterized protein (TIGR03067 family)
MLLAACDASEKTADQKDKPTSDHEVNQFEGEWEVVKAVSEGVKVPEEHLKEIAWSFQGDKVSLVMLHTLSRGAFTLDVRVNPKQINLKFDDEDARQPGIFGYVGGKLFISLPTSNENPQRPANFTGERGTGQMLYVLRKKVPPTSAGHPERQAPLNSFDLRHF